MEPTTNGTATVESLQPAAGAPEPTLENHPFGTGTGAPSNVPDPAAPRQDQVAAPQAPGTGPIPAPNGPGPMPSDYNDLAAIGQAVFEALAVNGPAAAQRLQDWFKKEKSIAAAAGKIL